MDVAEAAEQPLVEAEQPLVDGRELYRFFHAGDDETFALRGVSVSVRAGELVAVVGPSGSGKSTLLACLAGLDEPDGGHVRIAGQRIMLMQSGNLIEHLSVAQNIRAAQALVPRESGGDGRSRTRRRSQATQGGPSGPGAQHMLADVGLADRAGARPSTLSGGEAARAGLAVAMANDPPVLLADEPTGEIDREAEARVLELLRSRADRGKAVLVVTHSEIVAAAADRVVRMVDGRIADE